MIIIIKNVIIRAETLKMNAFFTSLNIRYDNNSSNIRAGLKTNQKIKIWPPYIYSGLKTAGMPRRLMNNAACIAILVAIPAFLLNMENSIPINPKTIPNTSVAMNDCGNFETKSNPPKKKIK